MARNLMQKLKRRFTTLSFVILIVAPLRAQSPSDEFFEKKIRPVLSEKCFGCHSSKLKTPMGGLVLDTWAGTRQGGSSGPAIVAGKPAESLLLRALRYDDSRLKMPPTGKLPDDVIASFEEWISAGAVDPRVDSAAGAPVRRIVDEKELAKGRQWWAFQPLRVLKAPRTAQSSWPRTKLDHFVLAKLEEKGLSPSSEADARTLIRRAYLDLIGLKPTYEEVESFANDKFPDRYEKLIDKLLASPHYGERWGRYWLDVVRYAEDNAGNITNPPYPHAWRYRDWIIEALNKDVSYDRFVQLQLAADLMPGIPRGDLRALGYMGMSPQDHKDVRLSAEVVGTIQLNDWDERVDAVSRGLLGLSVACARCHDHKFDPIPTKDYYRLQSVFASTQRATRPFFDIDPQTETRFMWIYQRMFDLHYTANLMESDPGSKPEQAARQVKTFRDELIQLQAEIDTMSERYPEIAAYIKTVPYPGERSPAQQAAAPKPAAPTNTLPPDLIPNTTRQNNAQQGADNEARDRKRISPDAPFMNSVYDAGLWWDESEPDLTFFLAKPGVPRDLPVYRGGNLSTPGEPAPRGFPSVLAKGPADFQHGSGRLELGEKIFTDAAALSARVIVNRVWGWHFEKHLVSTPSDFGTQGIKPTHPELLEDLSARLIANGWSLKWLHREIMLSATYRQSSHPRPEALDADPANQLLWRMNSRRIDIEAYRDSLLQISGNLDRTMYGPSVNIDTATRRTVYGNLSRTRSGSEVLKLYDVPQPMQHIPMRLVTINPLQALFVMNSTFIQDQAATLAKAVENERKPEDKIRALYRKVFARDPNPAEIELGLNYLDHLGGADLAQYAQALLSTNEVIFWP